MLYVLYDTHLIRSLTKTLINKERILKCLNTVLCLSRLCACLQVLCWYEMCIVSGGRSEHSGSGHLLFLSELAFWCRGTKQLYLLKCKFPMDSVGSDWRRREGICSRVSGMCQLVLLTSHVNHRHTGPYVCCHRPGGDVWSTKKAIRKKSTCCWFVTAVSQNDPGLLRCDCSLVDLDVYEGIWRPM